MRTYQDSKRAITPTSSARLWSHVPGMFAIRNLWHQLTAYLLQTSSLRIWQSRDSAGVLHWNVFDARTNRSATLHSEDDVRAWIEESYDFVPSKTWLLQNPSESWVYQSDR